MTKWRRSDSRHLDHAEHLRVLDEHLSSTDWPKIVGMRNMLAHQYADLDQEILQNTIDNRLGAFVDLVERLRKAADRTED